VTRLTPTAVPARKKSSRLVSPVLLLELGQKLMAAWQDRRGHDPRLNAMDYRDGLMIAFLALCPVRLDGSCGFVATQVPDPTRGLQSEWLRLLATS
jgi:hypothetical protein